MNTRRWMSIAVCLGILLLSGRVFGETIYVHSRIAPLMAGPDLASGKLGELELGSKLEADRLQNGWYHVVSDGKSGWVNRLMVKKYPPVKEKGDQLMGRQHLARRARIRPSSLASTAAARGLRAERNRYNMRLKADYKALEKMESFRVTPQDARCFVMKGSQNVSGQ